MRLALWVPATAFFLFLVVDWGTSVPTPRKCEQYDGDPRIHSDPKQCTSLRSTVFEGAEPIVSRTLKWLDIHNETVTGIATVFLAIITAGLVFIARDQIKTTRAQLRAYIAIEDATAYGDHPSSPQFTVPFAPQFSLTFKNCGQTPAYAGTYWIDVKVSQVPFDPDLNLAWKKTIGGKFDLPPTMCIYPAQLNGDKIASISTPERAREFSEKKTPFIFSGDSILSMLSTRSVGLNFGSYIRPIVWPCAPPPLKKLNPISNITAPAYLKHWLWQASR